MQDDMQFMDKVTTVAVDFRTLTKISTSKKQKTWLRAHPNFKLNRQTGKFAHIYDAEYSQWRLQQDVERNRTDVQQQDAEVPTEERPETGDDVLSRGTGEDTFG